MQHSTQQTTQSVTTSSTVQDVVRHFPHATRVFDELGIDSCCGGMATLEAAARKAGMAPHDLLSAIHRLIDEQPASPTERVFRRNG